MSSNYYPTQAPSASPFDEDTVTSLLGNDDLSGHEKKASLVFLTGSHAGRTLAVDSCVTLGRDPTCDVRCDAEKVSRRHACIERNENGRYLAKDLGSRNGTLVNGTLIATQTLEFGDRISLGGDVLLLFTQHDKLQEQLLHQQRMESIGQLAGGIAHDFNNLLGTILGNASVLSEMDEKTQLKDEEVDDIINDVKTAARQAGELTEQLLGFARRGRFTEETVDFTQLLSEVVRLCSRTFDPKITIVVDAHPEMNLLGDRGQLHQLLMNIFINARDAMPDGGQINVSSQMSTGSADGFETVQADQRLLLRISDTGVGMSDDVKRRAFEPFFTTKGLGRGTGLGLATVYGVVRHHGGDIRVDSQPGTGSSFTICLPAQIATQWGRSSTKSGVRALRNAGVKSSVLLVDDEKLQARSTRRLLEQLGYKVIIAENGKVAVEKYSEHMNEIGVVMLDVMMPVMGGVEACRNLHRLNPKVRVLAMSGYSEGEKARGMLDAGAAAFLQKPFDRTMLEAALGNVECIPTTLIL